MLYDINSDYRFNFWKEVDENGLDISEKNICSQKLVSLQVCLLYKIITHYFV